MRKKEGSRAVRIEVERGCNQRCVGCALPRSAPDEDEIFVLIEQAAGEGVGRIVFTGGEPTLSAALPRFVRAARGAGIGRVEIETNALRLAYPEYAKTLRGAGLNRAYVLYPAGSAAAWERFTGTPQSCELARKGIVNALDCGIEVVPRVPLAGELLPELAETVRSARGLSPEIRLIELAVFAPPTGAAVNVSELEIALASATAASMGVELFFSENCIPPPCIFEHPENFAGMFRYDAACETASAAGFEKPDVCSICYIDAECGGAPLGFEGYCAHPVQTVQLRDALGIRAVRSDWGIENFCTVTYRDGAGGESGIEEAVLRISYRCNQDCIFCWVAPDAEDMPAGRVEGAIREVCRRGARRLSFSGGEPTVSGNLEKYIMLAKECGARRVCLQTNAIRAADSGYCRRLAESGLDSAFVSFHSQIAAVSDAITGRPGSHEKTVAGLKNLIGAGIATVVNCVICRRNADTLPEYVDFVAETLPGVEICFSIAAPIYGRSMDATIVPRYSELRAPLTAALEKCIARGVGFSGLAEGCGLPLCILGGERCFFPNLRRVRPSPSDNSFLRLERCAGCALGSFCLGVRRFYISLYGDGEISPL